MSKEEQSINNLLEPIESALDLMQTFIQPTIFKGLKNNIKNIKCYAEKLNGIKERLNYARDNWNFTFDEQNLYEYVMFGKNNKGSDK